MSSELSSQKNSEVPSSKQMKKLQREFQKKKEQFYIKKRGLFRKAEQVARHCNTDIFIVAYNKDTNNMFTFQSDPKFNLEKISDLVLKDVQQGMLYRNKKFVDEDFDQVKQNLKRIKGSKKNTKHTVQVPSTKGPKVLESIICNNEESSKTNSSYTETVEELSMPMINAATQQREQRHEPQYHQEVVQIIPTRHHDSQKVMKQRYASPIPTQMRSVPASTPVTHQYTTDGHDVKTPHVMYYSNQMNDHSPRREIQPQYQSGTKYFSQTPYARHTYATAAPYQGQMTPQNEAYQQHAPQNFHQQEADHYTQNMQYHPHQPYQTMGPVSQFQPNTEPRVSHFLQENDRANGVTRSSMEPSKNLAGKSIDRIVDDRQVRQTAVNCDDIFMCCDRDYIRSQSRSRSRSTKRYQNQMPYDQGRMAQPDIKKVNAPQHLQAYPDYAPLPIQVQNLRKPQQSMPEPIACQVAPTSPASPIEMREPLHNSVTPFSYPEDQSKGQVNQQYNYAINISYGNAINQEQAPQGQQEFEFLDVKKGQKQTPHQKSKDIENTFSTESEKPAIELTKALTI